MPEEAVYLVEKQIAVLVDDSRGYLTPSPASLQNWASGQDVLSHQLLATRTEGIDHTEQMLSEEALKKREERKMKAKVDAGLLPLLDQDTTSEATMSLQPAVHSQNSSPTHTVVIPVSSGNFDWYCQKCIYTSIESAIEEGIWNFPSTPHERARCGIFRDLRGKGYFIGGGIKFGGEYLVYPGDPLRYHSHFVASLQEDPSSTLRPMEFVAHGRLGTATKKTHLLCAWDDEQKKAMYLSIEWAGFG